MITFENPIVRELIELAELMVGSIREDDYIDDQVRVFEKEAQSRGFVKLGSGFFSQAWSHPDIKKYAIKLGFKKEDSGAAYAAFCRDNQNLEGIPKIHGLDRFNSCYVVLMDKYLEFSKIKNLYFAKSNYHEQAGKIEIPEPACLAQFRAIRSITYGSSTDTSLPIYKTAARIHEFFRGVASFDLHEGNVMIDKYGHLVITDPVSFVKTCKKEHHEIKRGAVAGFGVGDRVDFRGRVKPRLLVSSQEIAWRGLQPNGMFADEAIKLFHEEVAAEREKLEWNECKKPKILKGATGAKKPQFLVAQHARQGIKRNR